MYFRFLLSLVLILVFLYYISVILNILFGFFKNCDSVSLKMFIPFYGWIKTFRAPKWTLIAVLILGLSGCVQVPRDDVPEFDAKIENFDISTGRWSARFEAIKFERDGHSWIYFGTTHKHLNIVHDPDCKCLKYENSTSLFSY